MKATRMDPAEGGGSQFKVRAREATIYSRWITNGYDFHVEIENATGDATCVEIALYPAAGLTYTHGWSGESIGRYLLNVPPFGAVKQVVSKETSFWWDKEGLLRISGGQSLANLVPGALHVNTYGYDPATGRFIHFFPSTANEGKTRSTW